MARRVDKIDMEKMTTVIEILDSLQEGNDINLAKRDGQVHILERKQSELRWRFPKLLGRLLAIDEQMRFGWTPTVAVIVLFSTFVLGLQVGWWEPIVGETVCGYLNTWYGWIVEYIIIAFLVGRCVLQYRSLIYRRARAGLIECMDDDGIDRDILLVLIEEEKSLNPIVYHLQRDHKLLE